VHVEVPVDATKAPKGHAMQAFEFELAWYIPTPQLAHEAPAPAYRPAGQLKQPVEPTPDTVDELQSAQSK